MVFVNSLDKKTKSFSADVCKAYFASVFMVSFNSKYTDFHKICFTFLKFIFKFLFIYPKIYYRAGFFACLINYCLFLLKNENPKAADARRTRAIITAFITRPSFPSGLLSVWLV